MARIRVLMATMAGERGGAEAVMDTIARGLNPDAFEVHLGAPAGSPLAERWRADGFHVWPLPPIPRLRRVDLMMRAVRRIAGQLRQQQFTLVYTHGITAQIVVGRAALRVGIPVVCHSHDEFNRAWTFDGLLHRAALHTPRAHTIVVSRTVADPVRTHLSPDVLTVVPNGVRSELVARESSATESPLVVWCGRLQRWKGAHVFLRAAQRVRAVRPDARFVIVGDALFGIDPDYPAEVRALAASLGVQDQTTFTGHVPDVRPWLASADVVVHCSTRPDPFPLVVLEAMMQGCAVVAFDRGGPREALDSGCAVLVPPDDETALGTAIADLLADPERVARLGQAARARALDLFSVERMVGRIAEILVANARKKSDA